MSLAVLSEGLRRRYAYRQLVEALRAGQPEPILLDPLEGATPFIVASLWRDLGRPVLWLHAGAEDARRAHEQVSAYVSSSAASAVIPYPEPDALPYEQLANDASTTRERLRALSALADFRAGSQEARLQELMARPAPFIIASAYAAAAVTLPPEEFQRAAFTLNIGEAVSIDGILSDAVELGYEPVAAIETPGTVSRRGGIVDIWPPQDESPARIELFGDIIDSIRTFDAATQRSATEVDEVVVTPALELLPSAVRGAPPPDMDGIGDDEAVVFSDELQRFADGAAVPGVGFFAPYFHRSTLIDHLPDETVIVVDRPMSLRTRLDEVIRRGLEIRDGQIERGKLPRAFPSPVATSERLEMSLADVPRRLHLEPFAQASPDGMQEGTRSFGSLGFSPPETYGGRIDLLSSDILGARHRGNAVVIASLQAQRLAEMLRENGHELSLRTNMDAVPTPGSLVVVQTALAEGWELSGGESGVSGSIITLSDTEIFGFIKRPRPVRRRVVRRDAFLSDFVENDYVVHVEHGIAQFKGTVQRATDGAEREYLALGYAGGDTLYVPTDQVDRVARYTGTGGNPTLTRLGGNEWANTKRRVKEDALRFAEELLRLYAEREVNSRAPFGGETAWQWELESSFPYQETDDQMQAIVDVKSDMEAERPMDRLICGDVGYGKTEVAVRAAFKAVAAGSQVALLVPTTVLAQQHYRTFMERLETFPLRVDMLSRLRTDAEQKETVAAMARGEVDVVIGTHRLLSRDVSFRNLGLVIIDEEQRFGVRHKEHLRKMRATVDVLTMTATPIPRTLHMALFGIRDMSRIDTAPEDRIPVTTFVAEQEDRTIREAILRETDRGGQVFFVHNRIQDIHRVLEHLQELVPEASFGVAHGRMPPESLESVMNSFAAQEFDVLICTTIIQAGLDMPNANTLIVDDADRLGLTQLYQLRGRVGRSSIRAYAYFLFRRDRVLTPTAERRLRAILSAAELGAGFRLAMKDLEIRGAGNILGAEQSGNVAAVGFDLYTRLLSEAIDEVRKGKSAHVPDEPGLTGGRPLLAAGAARAPVDLPADARIPPDYVEDTGTRLAVYERLANLVDPEEVETIRAELRDRFGPLPQQVDDLLLAVEVRAQTGRLRGMVRSIATEGTEIVVRLRDVYWLDREAIRRALPNANVGHLQIRVPAGAGADWREQLRQLMEEFGRMSGKSAVVTA